MISIFIASDHAGVELKTELLQEFAKPPAMNQYQVTDMGPFSKDSVDYPDYADLVCRRLSALEVVADPDQVAPLALPNQFGILICGSGQGMCMRANKFPHIRAALCFSIVVAHLAREHNNANILCLGSRTLAPELVWPMTLEFLKTPFAGGRHSQRVGKISRPV